MSDWITNRLPTAEDGKNFLSHVWVSGVCGVYTAHWSEVSEGQPWQPIPRPAPYVKPKRWTVKWNNAGCYWMLTDGFNRLGMRLIRWDNKDAAQRIADIYNEVVP